MILDRVENAARYVGLGERFETALRALGGDLGSRPTGRYELRGSEVFALVQEYETKPREAAVWEAHRQYADIQFIVSGRERFGFAPATALQESQPYDGDKDFALYAGDGDYLTLESGWFIVFYPGEAHMPLLQVDGPCAVKKLVLKIAM